jgi:hypothetical protein
MGCTVSKAVSSPSPEMEPGYNISLGEEQQASEAPPQHDINAHSMLASMTISSIRPGDDDVKLKQQYVHEIEHTLDKLKHDGKAEASIAAEQAMRDSKEDANSKWASNFKLEDGEMKLKQQYVQELEHSLEELKQDIAVEIEQQNAADKTKEDIEADPLERLKHNLEKEFGRIKTFEELIDVKPEDVLGVIRSLLWECSEKPEQSSAGYHHAKGV